MRADLQIVIDCADPQRMVEFWAPALGYVPQPPPDGFPTWRAYWQDMGVPAEELPAGTGDVPESIVDPEGEGPRVWFQKVPEVKSQKNRWHFDILVGGGRTVPLEERRRRVDALADDLIARGATLVRRKDEPEMGVYAAQMQDPEGNEFDVV